MVLKVALQMNPPSLIDIKSDSSFVLGLEALRRGYQLFYYAPSSLDLLQGRLMATLQAMDLRPNPSDFYDLAPAEKRDLSEMDVILMRQDPPFDMGYITATYLLEFLPVTTFVVNDPVSVRNMPEKTITMLFPDLMPATLVSASIDVLSDFHHYYGDIILKPLYGNGGMGVIKLSADDPNLAAMVEIYQAGGMGVIMAQEFLPEIKNGDKRIILIDGKPVGAINRMAASGSIRSNLHVGGRAQKSVLSPKELDICHRLEPMLKKHDIVLAGIDVIGEKLTEINVTSPTGLQEINRFDGKKLEVDFWDAVEKKLDERRRLSTRV